MMFDVTALFAALERCPGLQRKEWERHQAGIDRGMEAVLIQRAPRELATYALLRVRLQAMPGLWHACSQTAWPPPTLQPLMAWGRTQGMGGAALANVLATEGQHPIPSHRGLAALASLAFYHDRAAANLAMTAPWTEAGFARLATLAIPTLLEAPCRGPYWATVVLQTWI